MFFVCLMQGTKLYSMKDILGKLLGTTGYFKMACAEFKPHKLFHFNLNISTNQIENN